MKRLAKNVHANFVGYDYSGYGRSMYYFLFNLVGNVQKLLFIIIFMLFINGLYQKKVLKLQK